MLAAGCSSSTAIAPTNVTPATFTMTWNSTAFPATGVGLMSAATLVVTLWNTGSSAVPIASIADSDTGEFPLVSTCPAGGPLPSDSSCTLTIRFTPATLGDKTSTLTVDANSTTQTLSLTGTAVAVAPQLSIAPAGDLAPGVLTVTGTGGTPGGTAELHAVAVSSAAGPQNVIATTRWPLDTSGGFTAAIALDQSGSYDLWLVDLTSGVSSQHVVYAVP